MALYTSTEDVAGVLPPEFGSLVTQPVDEQSVAIQAATLVTTQAHEYCIPVVTSDASAAWTAEGDEIATSDPTLAELTVTPSKLGGLSVVSSELANDSDPAALRIMGRSLARDISRKIDQAFFSAVAAPAPAGLESLTGHAVVEAPSAWADLDPFAAALSEAEAVGATVTSFVANPADALALAQLKDQTDSNRPLLGSDPTVAGRRSIFGVPLLTSPYVVAGSVWAVPREYVLVVRRQDVKVDVSRHAYYSSDRVGVRAILRVGYAFTHPASIVEVTLAAG